MSGPAPESARGLSIKIALALALSAALAWLIYDACQAGLAFEFQGARYEFLQPAWLAFLGVAPLFVAGALRSLADLPRAQLVLSILGRVLLVGALAIALARPARTYDATHVSTVFLVDVSESITDAALEAARAKIEEALAESGDADVHLITFAGDAQVVPLGDDGDGDAGDGDTGDRVPPLRGPGAATAAESGERESGAQGTTQEPRATNLQAALQLAYGLYPPGHLRRAVLLSDGGQTHGDILSELARARDFGVRIHVLSPTLDAPPEVAIRELVIPDRLRVGDPFPIRARLFSSTPARVRIRLYQGETLNGLDSIRDLELAPGESEVEFRSVVHVAGPVTYRATLDVTDTHEGGTHEGGTHEGGGPSDRFAANNRYETSVIVPGQPTVLYVEGAQGRAQYLAQALSAADYDVDVRTPSAIPTSARELERYDFFVLSDVGADQVTLSQMDAIERYLRDMGGGFLMAGGERGFGLGGWQGTRMERLLPVRMDAERRRDQPTLALTLVIDRSGSMSGQKMELAKEAARATAELLGPDDYISVIGFDSSPSRVVQMQSARNRMRITRDIAQLRAGGGTAIFPALDMAYQDLSVTRARIKHVILLTDGQAPDAGISDLVQVMRVEGMTVSSIGLGSDVNRGLMESIANLGGGRSYFTSDPHNVPRIFMRETTTVSRSSAVEEYFQPIVSQPADFLRGIPIQSAPYLRGYVATRAKPTPAQVILRSDLGEPILARWRVGLGWSLAWTSDVKNRWAADWVRWPGYSRFWAQLIREHMRQRRRERLDMVARMQGDEVHVVVDAVGGDDAFLNGLSSTLTIDGPMAARRARGGEEDPPGAQLRRQRELPLEQTAPGRYEARFPLDAFGSFVLSASHRREGRLVAESATQLANPYPVEYATLKPDMRLLESIATMTHGELDPAPARLFDAEGEVVQAHEELWMYFLCLALGLFLIDLLLRRVRLFDREFKSEMRA